MPDGRWIESLHGSRDDFLHDFVCSSVDALNSSIGIHPCDEILVHVAVPSEQLQTLVQNAPLGLRAPQLCHRGSGRIQTPGNEIFNAAVNKGATDLNLRRNLGQLEPRILEINDGLPERSTLPYVVERDLIRAFHRSQGYQANDGSFIRQIGHQLRESATFHFAEDSICRHIDRFEEQLRRILSFKAYPVQQSADTKNRGNRGSLQ